MRMQKRRSAAGGILSPTRRWVSTILMVLVWSTTAATTSRTKVFAFLQSSSHRDFGGRGYSKRIAGPKSSSYPIGSWRKNVEPLFQSSDDTKNNGALVLDQESIFTLPIFPLRKRVRLPTDSLSLNLYEERYLAMSEYILTTNQMFGALYSSDKPQLVTKGVGPIIPMIEVGDIGVLCLVLDSQEGMVPTRAGPTVRRIQLNATAITRFRIEKILYDGTINEDTPPFILVESSLVIDNSAVGPDNSDTKRLVGRLTEAMQKHHQDKTQEEEGEEVSLSDATKKSRQPMDLVEVVDSLVCYEKCDRQAKKRELFSFAAASALFPVDASPRDMAALLRMESTFERLEKIADTIF